MLSGFIKAMETSFIWVFIATIPGLILSRYLIFPKIWGKIGAKSNTYH
jgi:PAT family beta-lactamase induction signal transducer AmpG